MFIYDEADYSLTLDYDAVPPEPALSVDDTAWAAQCVHAWRALPSERSLE